MQTVADTVMNAYDACAEMNCVNNNETNGFYSCYYRDTASALSEAEIECTRAVINLASSSTTDHLTLMHNRTCHGNFRSFKVEIG